jgi:hypothetical protein
LRCDAVNPPLLGMSKVVNEDALRRALTQIDETAGHLDYCVRPLLDEPWVLTPRSSRFTAIRKVRWSATNPRKPGRPSHCYHTYAVGI